MQLPPKQPREAVLDDPVNDLSRWKGRSGLIYLVREAIEEVDWPHKHEEFSVIPELTFKSVQLMTLEVYCYARGIYASEAVEEIIRKDEVLREVFPGSWPDPRTILKYRRFHRDAIIDCLRHVFSVMILVAQIT